jgi:lipoate-protein ligase A
VSPHPTFHLVRDSFPDRPAFDTAVSRAILDRVAAGEMPATMRVARPGAMVAFGKQDTSAAGYAAAVAAARRGGFEAVERLAGGRAAVFHEDTVAFALAVADPDAARNTHSRFRVMAPVISRALSGLGVDARVGEIPGEYCPGEYSVNARGRTKLMGVGQRIIKGGAHVGGVIVAAGGDRVRDVLIPVYEALGLAWDPATSGSVADEVAGTGYEEVERAFLDELAAIFDLVEGALDDETLALAERLEARHRSPGPVPAR